MLVLPEPVTPKRRRVGLLMDLSSERAWRCAAFRAGVLLDRCLARGRLEGVFMRRFFSTPTGRRREAQAGRGER